MTKPRTNHPDYFLIVIVLTLLILGFLVSVRVSADVSQQQFGKTTYYLFHQLIYGFLFGGILGLIAFKTPLSFFRKWSWGFILVNLILMILVFIPGLSSSSGGASRWINFGKFTFQPSELLKLSFIVYLSALLASRKRGEKNKKEWKLTLIPFLTIIGIIILLLYFQSDLSTLAVVTIAGFLIYFSSGTPILYNILVLLMGLAVFVGFTACSSYRLKRVFVLFGWLRDPLKMGYQIEQALIAIGSGGIFGLGLGMSHQSKYLPHPISDSIFALIGEELGLIGSLILVFLFLAFFWRGMKIAKENNDVFSRLFSIGFVSWICFQAFVNIGAMIKLIPLTGIPLPFISYGGSHLAVELIGLGIMLNISKSRK